VIYETLSFVFSKLFRTFEQKMSKYKKGIAL